ncbi:MULTISPECIES: DUF1453 domain-containing protein [Dyella]|uniref:DUF1453 domain-containing protein n=2 Tax=Dyella TaxID=231454 RepID=A0A4V6N9X9_9GAMM|nr:MULTISPECIES: DUF1453 domain-containing protein [Dyella]TBR36554.1 DUF1453 domain-containing protein [Dyella terrae]TCI08354.1 DUF1453 domain-containing protein [Dyella soli]
MAVPVFPVIMAPLMALAIYRRVRGSFGMQPIRRKRMMGRVVMFFIVACLSATAGLYNIRLLEGLLGGLALGGGLGLLGLKLTTFGRNAAGEDIYLPNPWIGAGLTVLLVGRLAWRFLYVMPQMQDPAIAAHAPPMGNSALTFVVIGLTFGYYIAYFIGLLIHHRRFQRGELGGPASATE